MEEGVDLSMRIGIDGTCWAHQRGYGRFLREILPALGKAGPTNQYLVYLDAPSLPAFPLGPPFEARSAGNRRSVMEGAATNGWRSPRELWNMGRAVKDPLDVFFFPSVYSYYPLPRRVPIVTAIHDTIADRNPQFSFSSKWQHLMWSAKVRLALAQTGTVVTVSQYSKRCIAEFFRIPPGRIAVIEEASSPLFRKGDYPPAVRPFLLYAGGISPNKNLPRLISAFAQTKARAEGALLVLAGDYKADTFKGNYPEVMSLIESLGLRDQARLTGFVTDEDLCRLYNTCTAFAMPSLDEGFGLPAMEAMACGRPVIASTGNSLEEVVGDAGLLVNPLCVRELAAAIDRLFEDRELNQTLAERALRRAHSYSWDRSARQLLDVFRAIADR